MNNEFRRFLIPRAVSRAHIVLTVSSYSRQTILQRFPSARVQVIPCSIARSWFVGKGVRKLDQRENCILAVTGNVPHKNPQRALEGYAAFVAQSDRSTVPHLRVVGMSSSIQKFRRRADALRLPTSSTSSRTSLRVNSKISTAVREPYCFRRSWKALVSRAGGDGIRNTRDHVQHHIIARGRWPSSSYFDPTDVAGMAAPEGGSRRRRQATEHD